MTMPFWRGRTEGIRAPVCGGRGVPMIMLWDDGTGPKPVTDIDWTMWRVFRRFDDIVAEATRKLDALKVMNG
jgi:hypothetical protein